MLTRNALTKSASNSPSSPTLLQTIILELTEPTPHGPDGDEEPLHDADLQEKLARLLVNFVLVDGQLDTESRTKLRAFIKEKGSTNLGLEDDDVPLLTWSKILLYLM